MAESSAADKTQGYESGCGNLIHDPGFCLVFSDVKRERCNLSFINLEKDRTSVIMAEDEGKAKVMEMTNLKRKAYRELLEWKNRPEHGTLEVAGARQVGKTYLVNRFADLEYKNKVYINLLDMSGELFLEHYQDIRKEMKEGRFTGNPLQELLKRYQPGFEDGPDTIVIIDEIQESAEIYNRIREFTRGLKSDFIVTGSYLGRILNREFKYSSGDLVSLEIHTLSFEEFLAAVGKEELFRSLDIFGGSDLFVYEEFSELYQVYSQIGGYPAVVLRYLSGASMEECREELISIIRLFTNESRRYFADILDYEAYGNLFCSIARVLVKEKKGLSEDSFSEELREIVVRDYSSNVTKASVNRAMDWLYSAGIIGFAGKILNCEILNYRAKARCYFMDIGLLSYFLRQIGCSEADMAGTVSENFVYLDIKRRMGSHASLAFEMPAFATWKNGEIDFYTKSLISGKTYAIEVKSGKNSGKTAMEVLEKEKVDRVLFAKGNTQGGSSGKIDTIPIYGISKYEF